MATQLADQVPRPSEDQVQISVDLPNQPAISTRYVPRTRDLALRNDSHYLALMAQRILIRHELVKDPKMLGNLSASVELHLTQQEREDTINQLRLQCRSPYEPVARALCDLITIRDPRVAKRRQHSFAQSSLIDNLLRFYTSSPKKELPQASSYGPSLEKVEQVAAKLAHSIRPWSLLIELHHALVPHDAVTYFERARARMRRIAPNRTVHPHQLYDDQVTEQGRAIHDYINLLSPFLAF
jgi:hypothetical protein